MDELNQLAVRIVRFVDGAQPGFVACEFEDADGRLHTLIDKVPIFSSLMLDATSLYPQDGRACCNVLNRWRDLGARELARVTTEPYGIESTERLSEFVVLSSQVSSL